MSGTRDAVRATQGGGAVGAQPTEDEILERARSLRGLIRDQQDEAERIGHYTEAVHERMLELGLYHLLTPRRYGGLEVSLTTWLRTVMEIARADPGTGWCYCLGHSHALNLAASWSEAVQDVAFGDPAGYFRASHSLSPAGTARRVDGGYVLNGVSRYQSGSPYSTHAIVLVAVEGETDDSGAPRAVQVLLPRDRYTPLDDWGEGSVLGMRASGSNSVAFEDAFVPSDHVVEPGWVGEVPAEATGAALHDSSLYVGSAQTFLGAELAAIVVGAARAALEEWEGLAHRRKAPLPPFAMRDQDPAAQREFAEATMKADSAEAILIQVGDTLGRWSERFLRDGEPFTRAMDTRLYGMTLEAGRLAADAVEQLFRSAGSSEARPGRRLERYVRDALMYRTHNGAQYGTYAQHIGATLLGASESAFRLPSFAPAPGGAAAPSGAAS